MWLSVFGKGTSIFFRSWDSCLEKSPWKNHGTSKNSEKKISGPWNSSHPCYKNMSKLSILRLPNPPIHSHDVQQPHWEKQLHLAQEACWIRGSGFVQVKWDHLQLNDPRSKLAWSWIFEVFLSYIIYRNIYVICMYSKGFECCQSLSAKLKMESNIINEAVS